MAHHVSWSGYYYRAEGFIMFKHMTGLYLKYEFATITS